MTKEEMIKLAATLISGIQQLEDGKKEADVIENELNDKLLKGGPKTAIAMAAALPCVFANSLASIAVWFGMTEKDANEMLEGLLDNTRNQFKTSSSAMRKHQTEEKQSEKESEGKYDWTRVHKL